jgi:hypothetical protein
MGYRPKGHIEGFKVSFEGRLAIQVKRSSDLPGYICDGYVFTVELVLVVPKMMHVNPPDIIADCRLRIENV